MRCRGRQTDGTLCIRLPASTWHLVIFWYHLRFVEQATRMAFFIVLDHVKMFIQRVSRLTRMGPQIALFSSESRWRGGRWGRWTGRCWECSWRGGRCPASYKYLDNHCHCLNIIKTYTQNVEWCNDDKSKKESVVVKDGECSWFIFSNLENHL